MVLRRRRTSLMTAALACNSRLAARAAAILVVFGFPVLACGSAARSAGVSEIADGGSEAGENGDAAVDGRPSGRDAGPVSASSVCSDFARRSCALLTTCRGSMFEHFWTSSAECEARTAENCTNLYPPASVVRGDDAKTFSDCMQSWTCDSLYETHASWLYRRYDPFFRCAAPRVTEASPDGAECSRSPDCESGACGSHTIYTCGRCVTPLAPGAPCNVDKDSCREGECTVPTGGKAYECVPYASLGEPCDARHICRGISSCREGRCQAPKGAGAACSVRDDCDSSSGFLCNGDTGRCERVAWKARGEACLRDDPFNRCGKVSDCVASDPPYSAGVCTAAEQNGKDCGGRDYPGCVTGLVCKSQVCTPIYGLREVCGRAP
jgi:hypothetical protein